MALDNIQLKHFESICVKEIKKPVSTTPHVLPIYATASFAMENAQQSIDIFSGKETGHIYTRYGNPTIDAVASKIAKLESFETDIDAQAFLCSTGMAAIYCAIVSQLKPGDKIITQGNLYGGTTVMMDQILIKGGIETIFTDLSDYDQLESTIKKDKQIKLLYLETPTNPTLSCLDISAIASICKSQNILSVIDNTFSTPFLQRPFNYGIDIVVHSSTKYLNGHGNAISGVVIVKDPDIASLVLNFQKLVGGTTNPFDAWLLNNGMKTLALRMEKHCSNAQKLADFLAQHPKVAHVNYPGLDTHPSHDIAKKQMALFGGMLSFELKSGFDGGTEMMDKLKHCTIAPTLGDVDTLVLHPASSSHLKVSKEMRERNGITDGLIRISVGIENPADIIADIDQSIA